jgi:hypothetical protein
VDPAQMKRLAALDLHLAFDIHDLSRSQSASD